MSDHEPSDGCPVCEGEDFRCVIPVVAEYHVDLNGDDGDARVVKYVVTNEHAGEPDYIQCAKVAANRRLLELRCRELVGRVQDHVESTVRSPTTA
jgi:hypothetical protein